MAKRGGFPGGMPGNMNNLMKQAQKMQKKMEEAQAALAEKTVETTSGGGAVKIVITGKRVIQSIKINPEVVDPEDIDMLSELVIAAVNEAIRAASTEKAETMERLSGGLNMPGMF